MSIETLLNETKDLIAWLNDKCGNVEFDGRDDRVRLGIACFDICSEHHKSIILLIENRRYGSAFALVRCLFESAINGIWILRCSQSQEEAKKLYSGKLKKQGKNFRFQDLLDDLETKKIPYSDLLKEIKNKKNKNNAWKAMNAYTHSGTHQLHRRMMMIR